MLALLLSYITAHTTPLTAAAWLEAVGREAVPAASSRSAPRTQTAAAMKPGVLLLVLVLLLVGMMAAN